MKVRSTLTSISQSVLVHLALVSIGWPMVQAQRARPQSPAPARSPQRKAAALQKPELLVQNTHSNDVSSIAFSPDGRLLATGSWDTTIMVREAQSGRLIRVLGKHPGGVTSIAFSPSGEMLASGGWDNNVKLWNVRNGNMLRNIPGVGFVAFSPREELIACAAVNGRKIDVGDYAIKLIDAKTGRLIRVLKGHKDQISSLVFSPDARTLISGSGPLNNSDETYDKNDTSIRLWNTRAGALLSVVELPNPVRTLVFSPDGKMFASTNDDLRGPWVRHEAGPPTISLWDTQNAKLIRELKGIRGRFVFSPDGRHLASGGSGIRLWNAQNGNLISTLLELNESENAYDNSVLISPDGKTLAATVPFGMKLWDTESSGLLRSFVWHVFSVASIKFDANGQMFALGGRNGSAKIWDARSGTRTRTLEVTDVSALSRDGKRLASVSDDKASIVILDTQSGKPIRRLPGESEELTSMDFRDDGLLAASYKKEGKPRPDGGNESVKRIIKVWDTERGRLIRSFPETEENYFFESDWTIGFSPDGKTLASWGEYFDQINLWDPDSGKLRQKVPTSLCHAVAFSRDGKMIAAAGGITGSSGFGGPPVGFVQLWNLQSAKQEWLNDFQQNQLEAHAVGFSVDGSLLAVGDVAGQVKLLDVRTGKLIRSLSGEGGAVRSIAFYPHRKFLASIGGDSMTRLWATDTGELLASMIEFDNNNWLVVAPDGLFDGTAEAIQEVSWRMSGSNNTVTFDAFFNDFYHPNLLSEVLEGGRPRASIDIAAQLQLPGLRAMLSQGSARFEQRRGLSMLCFNEKPTVAPQLFSDAQALAFDINDLICDEEDTGCRCRKELPSGAQLEVTTVSNKLKSDPAKLPYEAAKTETRRSTLHVQTIGVGNYNLASSGFRSLPSSVSGAKEIQKLFADQVSNPQKSFLNIRMWDGLYDAAASRESIRRRLTAMATEVKEDDVVFLFFSGHGIVPAGQEMFYFAPIDMRGPNPSDQRESGLNTAMLAEAIREMPARRVVLIIDACQSGGAIESLGKIAEVKARVAQRRAQSAQGQIGGTDHRVGVYVIAAATPLQEAVQPKNGNGALVAALLEALTANGQTIGGEVSMRDLVKYIERRLPEISEKIGQRHTPMVVSLGVDFPIAERRVEKP
ncbi:MAG TPA: caspase family protein [Pyrinomonadaceae bacterium]|nr:caspase family protein [Pyrinomonadaceae bacterium]